MANNKYSFGKQNEASKVEDKNTDLVIDTPKVEDTQIDTTIETPKVEKKKEIEIPKPSTIESKPIQKVRKNGNALGAEIPLAETLSFIERKKKEASDAALNYYKNNKKGK
jgi:hypothetical protein